MDYKIGDIVTFKSKLGLWYNRYMEKCVISRILPNGKYEIFDFYDNTDINFAFPDELTKYNEG